jgi:hypothetical protein
MLNDRSWQVIEKPTEHGHSDEAKTTKNLQAADSRDKQGLRCAPLDFARGKQDDRSGSFFNQLLEVESFRYFLHDFARLPLPARSTDRGFGLAGQPRDCCRHFLFHRFLAGHLLLDGFRNPLRFLCHRLPDGPRLSFDLANRRPDGLRRIF